MKTEELHKVREEIRAMISEIIDVPVSRLKDDTRFIEDLGVDSMMALEIIASIEKKYRIVVPEAEITNVRTPNSIYEILEKLL